MKLVVAMAFAAFALPQASAARITCSGGNFAKTMEQMTTMPHGPKRMAMMREMTALNTDLSNGNTGAACRHYAIAVRIQNNVRDPFESLHEE